MKGIKQGFTLIELLVVIAIIGILSSVVLASLNDARNKGADASIKSNLAGARTEAELFYDTSNSYGTAYGPGICNSAGSGTLFNDARVRAAIAGAVSASGGVDSSARCYSNGSDYVVTVRLKANTAQAWCVDSSGTAAVMTYNSSWTTPSPVACQGI